MWCVFLSGDGKYESEASEMETVEAFSADGWSFPDFLAHDIGLFQTHGQAKV